MSDKIAIAKAAALVALGQLRNGLTCSLDANDLTIIGTTYILGDGADVDVLAYVPGFSQYEHGFDYWEYGGSGPEHTNDTFGSWKRTVDGVVVNLIITGDKDYHDAWITSAEVCRFLHLQGVQITAGTRHGIHEIIMDDASADEEVKHRGY